MVSMAFSPLPVIPSGAAGRAAKPRDLSGRFFSQWRRRSQVPRLRLATLGFARDDGGLPAFGDGDQPAALLHDALGRNDRLQPPSNGLARQRFQVVGQMAEGVAERAR